MSEFRVFCRTVLTLPSLFLLGSLAWGCGGGRPPGGRAGSEAAGGDAREISLPGDASQAGPVELVLTPQESGTAALLQAVSPVSEEVVWVSGHQGTYARTLDGGVTWSAAVMTGEEELQFRDIEAFDGEVAYLMSAGSGDLSRIYRTDDGGASWVLQYTAMHPDAFLDCMAFWDRDRGLVYGDAVDKVPFILRTEDGGGTWARVSPQGLPSALDGEGGFAASGTCIATGGDRHAWIATGNGARARVLLTSDGGESWAAADVPVVGGTGAGLTTVRMGTGGGIGLVMGGVIGGDTLRTVNVASTRDGGIRWVPGGSPAMRGPIYGSALVAVPSGSVVVAVGPGGIDWSRDLGNRWSSADTVSYWAVAFASPGAGWAVGPGGRITRLALR
jgi:photosystem II stability/assembly factor-like uncharacterized protein